MSHNPSPFNFVSMLVRLTQMYVYSMCHWNGLGGQTDGNNYSSKHKCSVNFCELTFFLNGTHLSKHFAPKRKEIAARKSGAGFNVATFGGVSGCTKC